MNDKKSITYAQVGDNYFTKDPIKKLAQTSALQTAKNLTDHGFSEITDSRGESAFVWNQGNVLMAMVTEGLGTKNLVADETRKITGKTYYNNIANDTVAMIINDLVTVGAKPLTISAYWAIENNDWLQDEERMKDLINGWKKACDDCGVVWGGGETPTLKGIIEPDTIDLGGAAVGIIEKKENLITDKKLQTGDRIILIKSNGINSNGISLARAIAKKLPEGYGTKLSDGTLYGEAILQPCNLYAKLIQSLQKNEINLHYIAYISGHGFKKIMRARGEFTYMIEKIFDSQELFSFIQKHAELDEYEMYQTYNMGNDYALFIPEQDVEKTLQIITENGFEGMNAGYIEKGPRQVVIKPKNITYTNDSMDLR